MTYENTLGWHFQRVEMAFPTCEKDAMEEKPQDTRGIKYFLLYNQKEPFTR
jgi:hypothetical protein